MPKSIGYKLWGKSRFASSAHDSLYRPSTTAVSPQRHIGGDTVRGHAVVSTAGGAAACQDSQVGQLLCNEDYRVLRSVQQVLIRGLKQSVEFNRAKSPNYYVR